MSRTRSETIVSRASLCVVSSRAGRTHAHILKQYIVVRCEAAAGVVRVQLFEMSASVAEDRGERRGGRQASWWRWRANANIARTRHSRSAAHADGYAVELCARLAQHNRDECMCMFAME